MAWTISAALVIQPTLVYALPTGGTVVGGEANIVAGNSSLTVNQTTERALINWTGFDIGGAESVHFNQPGASSISLNRVNSASASQINGSLSSNGQVWIISQNGVMFGQGAQVNVGGLLVSTAGISDDNFMNGNYNFNIAGNPNGAIINDGNISIADAGAASFVAPVVRNNGVIQAKLGTVNLASGDTFALDMYGDGLISVEASAALQQQLVSNSGLIEANGGSVLLTAAAAGDVVDSLINMDGIIRANSIGEKNGTVVLYAEGSNAVKGNSAVDKGQKQGVSTVLVSGTIEAKGNAAGEKGGNIDVLGDHVGVMSGGFIDASGQIGGGKIRIGGDYFGGGDTPTALKTLVQPNTSIKANAIESGDGGRITLWADDVTWFGGDIEAKGGALSGNGGFVEVSGKQYLGFRGMVDTRAENGETGLLLLDPADIVIANGSGDSAADGNNTFSGAPSGAVGTILSGDAGPSTIYESELEGLGANTNIALAATNSITINNLADNNLNLAQDGGNSVSFTAGGGGFNMDSGDTITTAGGALNVTTSGGTSTFGSIATNGGLITLNMGGDITVSGVISGTGTGLTRQGSGMLRLTGNNTYTGDTTVTSGDIEVGHNNAFGTGTLVMNGGGVVDDGTIRTLANNVSVTANDSAFGGSAGLVLNGTTTFMGEHALRNFNSASLTMGNINLSGSAADQLVTLAAHGTIIVNGVIANGGTSTASSIRKNGAETLILNGNNTFSGGLNLATGTLQVGHNNAVGTGTLWLNGGTLTANGSRTLANNVTLENDSAIGGSSAIQFSGTFGNVGGLRYLDVSNSATTTFGNIDISSDGTDRSIIFTGSGNSVVNGVVANGGGSTGSALGLISSGSLTLNGNNTYGGNFYHDGGTLILGHNNALGTGNFLAYGGTVQGAGGTRTIANNLSYWDDTTFAGSVALIFNGDFYNTNNLSVTNNNTATTTFSNIDLSYDASNFTLTFGGTGNTVIGGVISNGGGGSTTSTITKIGSGTLTLDGNNTYGGTTTLTAGTIEVGHNNALGTGTLSLNGGALQGDGTARTLANNITLDANNSDLGGTSDLVFNGTFASTGDYTLRNYNSGTSTFNGAFNLSNSATDHLVTLGAYGGDTVINGVVANGGTSTLSAFRKNGFASLFLNNANTYSGGTLFNQGTIVIGNNAALGTGYLNLSGGTLQGDGVARTLANDISLASDSTIGGSSNLTFSGTFGNLGANRVLTIDNSGTTTFGNIDISNTGTGRILMFAGDGNTIVNGVIASGGGSTDSDIRKYGTGVLTLNNANTHRTTAVYDGVVVIGNNSALGTGTVEMTGGTLRADGSARTVANNLVLWWDAAIGGSSNLTFNGKLYNGFGDRTLTVNNSGTTTFGSADLSVDATDNTLTLAGTGNTVISGVVANGGTSTISGITKTGSGTLTLDGNNTYGGTTTLTAGTIEVGHNNALGTGALSLSGGTLRGDGSTRTLANDVTLDENSTIGGTSALQFDGTFGNLTDDNRTLTVNNSGGTTFGNIAISATGTRELTLTGTGDITVNGVLSGGSNSYSSLAKDGSGKLTLNGANTWAGNFYFMGGTVQIGNNTALGSSSLGLFGDVVLQGDGVARSIANDYYIWGGAGNAAIIGGNSDLTFTGTFSGLTGNRTLTVNNSGTTTFGNMNISQDATDRTLTINGTGNVVLGGTIANGSTSTASGITKAGSGTMTVNGNNTYGGNTTLTAGTIAVGHNNALGTGTLSLNGGTLQGDGTARTLANNVTLAANSVIAGLSALNFNGTLGNLGDTRILTVNNSALTTLGDINISDSATDRMMVIIGSGNVTVDGVIANGSTSTASQILINSGGTLTFNGANTYGGGTTLTGGTLVVGDNAALGTGVLALNGGTLRGDGVARTLANTVHLNADSTIAGSSALQFDGTFGNLSANRTLTVSNSANTTFDDINISSSATDRELFIDGAGNVIVNGVIANGGGSSSSVLTHIGSGTLVLNGANTFGRYAQFNNGITQIGNDSALGSGSVWLAGGTWRGDGTTRTLANNLSLFDSIAISGSSDLIFNGNLTSSGDLTITNNSSGATTFANMNLSDGATDRTLTIAGTGNTTVSGVIANGSTSTASGITKTGSGILTFSGNNTYAGDTTINGGTLRLGDANRLANTTDVVIGASGTFDLNSFNETVATITNSGAITMGDDNTLTTTGAQTHTGSISGTDISIIANTGNLTFDTISANTLFAQAVAGDIILNDQITAAANAGTSITLVADDQFINNHGATALQTAGTARWLVYSEDSAANTRGSLTGFNRYGCTYNAGSPSCAAGTSTPASGNGFYFAVAPTITITGLTANNKVYDGTTTATLAGTATANGAINGDTVMLDASGVTASFDTKDVGVGKSVTIAGFTNAMGYLITQPGPLLANITAKALTIAGLTANNKTYDGNTTATLAGTGSLVGVVGVETVGFNTGTATFDNPNVGTGKTVTGAGFSLTGADMGNYSLTQPSWFADIIAASSGGGGGGVSSGNQSTINAILSLLGLLGNNAMVSGTSAGGTYQFSGGIPEPSRMEIPPVEDEIPASATGSKPAHDHKKVDPIIEINAMIDLTGLLKDTVETAAGKQVAVDAKPEVKANPEVQGTKDEKNCNSLLGNTVCASKIFSTIGVPNI